MDFAGGATNNGAFIGTPLVLPTTDSVSLMFWVYYDDQPASPGDYNLMGVAKHLVDIVILEYKQMVQHTDILEVPQILQNPI